MHVKASELACMFPLPLLSKSQATPGSTSSLPQLPLHICLSAPRQVATAASDSPDASGYSLPPDSQEAVS